VNHHTMIRTFFNKIKSNKMRKHYLYFVCLANVLQSFPPLNFFTFVLSKCFLWLTVVWYYKFDQSKKHDWSLWYSCLITPHTIHGPPFIFVSPIFGPFQYPHTTFHSHTHVLLFQLAYDTISMILIFCFQSMVCFNTTSLRLYS
jgi:hypothetical protein